MVAVLGDLAVSEDQNGISVPNGTEPIGDSGHDAVAVRALDRIHDGPLAVCIQRARGLVEQEQLGFAGQSSRDGQPLALSAAELCAIHALLGPVAFRQRRDEFVDVRLPCGLFGPFARGL
jgi:hypothetical protein